MNLLTKAEKTVSVLKENKKTVAIAESCTGGMIASSIVSVPGASAVFGLGVVTYATAMKSEILGVKVETLMQFGAVSRQTAAEMSIGVRRKAHADIGIAVTGVAGPEPAEGKDPGTVYIAVADQKTIRMEKLTLDPSNREDIRHAICLEVFQLIQDYFEQDNEK